MSDRFDVLEISIPDPFLKHLPDALIRFQYLYPDIEIATTENIVKLVSPTLDRTTAIREFNFCLYRQKIYEDALPLRKRLIEGVFS